VSKKDSSPNQYRVTTSDNIALFRPTLHSVTMLLIHLLKEEVSRDWIHLEIVVAANDDETPEAA
jgi:hypothetical protein